jgi:hypothetical protein
VVTHLRRWLLGTAVFVGIAVPALLVDPAARSVVDHHPSLAAYLAAAVGVAHAVVKGLQAS